MGRLLLSFALLLSAACCKSQTAVTENMNATTAATEKTEALQAAATEKTEALAVTTEKTEALQSVAPEKAEAPSGENKVQATGLVRLVGSGTFPEMVIRGEGKQWYLAKEEMHKLQELQHRTVTVEAEETVQELKWANGRSAGKRRYLHNIKLIRVE